jgi:hypothetical protein
MPKGNLDTSGQYFIWTSNAGTNRLDAPQYAPRIQTWALLDIPSSFMAGPTPVMPH